MIRKPADRFLLDKVKEVLPPKYKQWAPTLIQWACRFIAIMCAWYVQKIISSVQSALRGGLMASQRSLKIARARKWMPEVALESLYDDYVGYAIASMGLYFQLRYSFAIPFPLNVVLWPVTILEWWLCWFI